MAPPTKRSKAKKRSGLSHGGSSLTCYRCPEKKFSKDSEMESHNRRFHKKDSKKCRRCGTVFRRRRDLKFHKATTHGAKKKAETSKPQAPAESSSSSSSSSSTSSEADGDLERNVDGGGEGIEI